VHRLEAINPLHNFKPEIKLFFIVAAVSVVLAVAGILLLQGVMRNRVSHTPPVPSPQPQTQDTIPLDTSDWQTYRNDEFGFEVKYPDNWSIEEDYGRAASNFIFDGPIKEDRVRDSFFVQILHGLLYSLDEIRVSEIRAGNDVVITNINEIPALIVDSSKQGCHYKLLSERRSGDLFTVSCSYTPIENQILSTFRFIEQDLSSEEICEVTGGNWTYCPENPSPNAGVCLPCQCPSDKHWNPSRGCVSLGS